MSRMSSFYFIFIYFGGGGSGGVGFEEKKTRGEFMALQIVAPKMLICARSLEPISGMDFCCIVHHGGAY